MNPFLRLAPIGIAAALAGCVNASGVNETTRYFAVGGTTVAEIDRDLNRFGPEVPATGVRHPGATEVKFDGRITYRNVGDRCAVDNSDIGLDLNILLPKWSAPRAASNETRLVWLTLEEDIRRHENHHAAIAKAYLQKLKAAITALKPQPDCAAMEAKVKAVTDHYLAAHAEAQRRFDADESRKIGKRLRRALAANIRKYSAR